VCAAARIGKNRKVKREIRRATDFDSCVRELTVRPLLPVLAHVGGLKSRCAVILTGTTHLHSQQIKRSFFIILLTSESRQVPIVHVAGYARTGGLVVVRLERKQRDNDASWRLTTTGVFLQMERRNRFANIDAV
jgi:hypothetical protein